MLKNLSLIACCMLVSVLLVCDFAPAAGDGPIHVFILAGQSNMQGKGRIEIGNGGVSGAIGSLRYLVNNDPTNYGHLVNPNGT